MSAVAGPTEPVRTAAPRPPRAARRPPRSRSPPRSGCRGTGLRRGEVCREVLLHDLLGVLRRLLLARRCLGSARRCHFGRAPRRLQTRRPPLREGSSASGSGHSCAAARAPGCGCGSTGRRGGPSRRCVRRAGPADQARAGQSLPRTWCGRRNSHQARPTRKSDRPPTMSGAAPACGNSIATSDRREAYGLVDVTATSRETPGSFM